MNNYIKERSIFYAQNISEFEIGVQAGKISTAILKNHKLPALIPSVFADNFELKVR